MSLEKWLRGSANTAAHNADLVGLMEGIRKGLAVALLIPIELLEVVKEIVNLFGWLLMGIQSGIGRMQADLRGLGLILIGENPGGGCGDCPSCEVTTLITEARVLMSELRQNGVTGEKIDATDKDRLRRAMRKVVIANRERVKEEDDDA